MMGSMRIYPTRETDYSLLRRAKAAAAMKGQTLADLIRDAIRAHLGPEPE